MCVCAGSMDVDLDRIIHCIKQGDEHGVETQLQQFNKEVTHSHIWHVPENTPVLLLRTYVWSIMSVLQFAQCFFFDAEERDRRKVSNVILLLSVKSVLPVFPSLHASASLAVCLWLAILLHQLPLILSQTDWVQADLPTNQRTVPTLIPSSLLFQLWTLNSR